MGRTGRKTVAGPAVTAGPGLVAQPKVWLTALLLALVVAGVFLPAVRHEFIRYDDPVYVTENARVTTGLSWANAQWAFTSFEASNWHPLTWLSHQLDCQLFGLDPAGHHLTSVLLHALNSLLLFVALTRLTGSHWRSLAVALLFGLHPLHVESVAWVSERKDVLSATFWTLTLWAWALRAERLRGGRPGARVFYGLAVGSFALGLMAKPMLVTLPCVLLLLDYWPLGRWRGRTPAEGARLIWEKLPFFALSGVSSAITLYAQSQGGTVKSLQDFTLPVRAASAVIAYARYLEKTFWPSGLCVFYPNFAEAPSVTAVVLCAALLGVIGVGALVLAKRWPWLPVGWFGFLGTLVPVIGFVQVGGQSMADRYTYLPLIGVFVAVVWAVGDWLAPRNHGRAVAAGALVALAAVLIPLTVRQLSFWKNAETLFRRAIAVTENNWVAHHNLSLALAESSPDEARREFQETMRIIAEFAARFERKGIELAAQPGREEEAITQFRTAIRIMRALPGPHYQLALVLARRPEHVMEAVAELEIAIQLNPDDTEARLKQARLLAGIPRRLDDCIAAYQELVGLMPQSAEAHYELGLVLMRVSWRSGEALMHFDQAVKLKPDLVGAREMADRLRRS